VTHPLAAAFLRVYTGSTVIDVVDGDTVRCFLDLGGDIWWKVLCRLHGIAAREKSDPGGPEARAHLSALIPAGTTVHVRSVSWDKYAGRIQAGITRADGLDVALQMLADGYAAPWDGRGTQPKPPWPIPPNLS
jgi:micrococcal nuclease